MRDKARFVFYKGTDEMYYWRFIAPNGRITANHEGYATMYGVKRAAGGIIKQIGAFLNGYVENPRHVWIEAEKLHGNKPGPIRPRCGPIARTPKCGPPKP